MTKDLTVGSPMKLIWQFSIPLVLGNLFQQMITGRYRDRRSYLGTECPDQCKFYYIHHLC